ncbi:MAG: trans-sulfuration enzyme family protein, partial [Alphaproteobacteria bacterium]
MSDRRTHRPETLAAQALGLVEPATRAIVPPIVMATTFERGADLGYAGGVSYGRHGDAHATRQVEVLLAQLEGGARALAFASGMASAAAVFLTLHVGDHVVVQQPLYYGIGRWVRDHGATRGLVCDFVQATEPEAVARALRPGSTRLVWIETPANPTWDVVDIAQVAALAHRAGALLVVDSTVATPVLTRPIAFGADVVMHSATKYLNGHSDVLAGALVVAPGHDDLVARLIAQRNDHGAVLGPFEAWLLLRGMRTLYPRVRQASATADRIARHLAALGTVARVLYPGLADHPGHAIAVRQMTGGFG